MASSRNTVYVVTGANRGIGLGLVSHLLQRPSTTVIGTVRSQSAADSLLASFEGLSFASGSMLYPLILDFSTAPDPTTVRDRFSTASSGVDYIDVLICNAGYTDAMTPSLTTSAASLRSAFEVNAIGPLMTFQGLWPLLQKSTSPKFILMTSSLGSISAQEPVPSGGYGPSKAAADWIAKSLHLQMAEQGLVSVAIHPGFGEDGHGCVRGERME